MPFYTPLRYPGGKRKLCYFLMSLLEKNNLTGCSYAEPYAGGAGLALQLLFENYASEILINDLNVSIYSFWNSVLNHTDEICRLIQDTPVTLKEWKRQKEIQSHAETLCGSLELGFSTFFLNRTNRSGIIKGGVIGGKQQSGEWKINARFQKKPLITRIQSIASRKKQIILTRKDAVDFLKPFSGQKRLDPCFIYMDPPYFVKGAGLYDNFYQIEDHELLSDAIRKISNPWIVSYDNVPEVQSLYRNYRAITYSLNYTAQIKASGVEFMAFADVLTLPDVVYKGAVSFGCMRQLAVV